ncbi:MAG: nucleotidyltransferase domain-containing protein [Candidatus Caldarchaeales archaeon]
MEEYLEWLAGSYSPELVVVFGSFVTGEWTENSDVDLLVVSEKLAPDASGNYVLLKRPGIDPIGYSPGALLRESSGRTCWSSTPSSTGRS